MNANIHIVEDEQSIVTLVEYNLSKEGFKVNSSTNGEDGFKAIKDTKIMAPPTDCLSPIGGENLEKGLRKEIKRPDYGLRATIW